MGISNELQPSAFASSPEIRFLPKKPGTTVTRGRPSTLTVFALLKNTEIGGWRLKAIILVQIRRVLKGCMATTWLEGIAEYGVGKSENEAVADLVVSLGEYRESLERRQAQLGDSAQTELDYLRRVIERLSSTST